MIPPKALALSVVLFASAWTARARADFLPGLTPDRYVNYVSGSLSSQGWSSIAQSFTPNLDRIEWAALAVMGGATDYSLAVELYQGSGLSGPLLATSRATSLASTYGQGGLGAWAYFYFDRPIALTPGSQYTLKLVQLSGGIAQIDYVAADSIRGTGYLGGQAITPNFSLTYAEGVFSPAAVPEPTSLSLCGVVAAASLAVAGIRRRRRPDAA